MHWIYLSKKGQDEYIERFARGSGKPVTVLETWNYDQQPDHGLVLRGIMKHKIIKQCWQDGRQFRFMDTGYLGNRPGPGNRNGWKVWHRIIENDIQHNHIVIDRPADRWQRLKMEIKPWQKTGNKILIAVPDEKPCAFYDTTPEIWLTQTLERLTAHTDRPMVIRRRTADPDTRTRDASTSFSSALSQDVWAVVTFNSVAAIEAIMAGIPAFVTAPTHAAAPVASRDLAQIESPWLPTMDELQIWARHLAYGQFHNNELEDGTAQKILDQTREIMAKK